MGESKMLKVTGILMIIGAGLGLLGGISLLAIGGAAGAVDPSLASSGGLIMALALVAIVVSAVQLVAGIMGVKNWNKPEKAQICFILGIAIIVVGLISDIISIASAGFSASIVTSAVTGLIIPALYTYGAMQLKKAA